VYDETRKNGWPVISMKNDWKKISPLLRPTKTLAFSANGAVFTLAWGIAPGIAIVGGTSAESAFQSGVFVLMSP